MYNRIPSMEEDEEITRTDSKERASSGYANAVDFPPEENLLNKWVIIVVYAVFVLVGQAAGALLGRQYFDHGGKSKWLATLVQNVGFPIAMPFLLIPNSRNYAKETNSTEPSVLILVGIYVFLGVLLAGDSMLFSVGLQYLPVSTYTLIVATQLGFNALFSASLKLEKLTVFVINAAVLLTLSSVVLVLDPDHSGETTKASKKKYALGFACTLIGSAGNALMLSLTQLAFEKVIKTRTLRVVLDMSIYQCLVATGIVLIGLFASGEWDTLHTEMKSFEGGQVLYINNLVWTAVSWQVFTIGSIGLIFKVTSLFSNAISLLGIPFAPVLAVIFYHDKITGAKIISALLAIWGFLSYLYQNYLDELEAKAQRQAAIEALQASTSDV